MAIGLQVENPLQVRLEDGRGCSLTTLEHKSYCCVNQSLCSDICSDKQQWYMHLGCRRCSTDPTFIARTNTPRLLQQTLPTLFLVGATHTNSL